LIRLTISTGAPRLPDRKTHVVDGELVDGRSKMRVVVLKERLEGKFEVVGAGAWALLVRASQGLA
jgi:hypothetical protein